MQQTNPRLPGALRRDATLAAALLVLLLAGVLALAEWRDYGQQVEAGQTRAQALSELLAAETETAALTVDRTLRGIWRTVANNGNGAPARPALSRLATQEAREQPVVRAFLITGPDGAVLVDSESAPPRPLNLGARRYFVRLRESPSDELAVDVEAGAAPDVSPSVVFARRLTGPDGAFVGVAVAVLDPNYFASLYRGVARGTLAAVVLQHADGAVLTHYNTPADARDGGQARITGTTPLSRLPLVITVALDRQRVLAHWLNDALFDGSVALIGLSTVLGGIVILLRYLRRQDEERRQLAERELALATANDHLMAALAHTNHGTVLYDREHRLALCNRRYLELMRLRDGALTPGMNLAEMIEVLRRNGTYSATELAEMTAHHRSALLAGESQNFFEHLSDGTILEVRSDPIRAGGLLLTVTDITASVASAEALRSAKEEAERASEAKSDFLALVSHDLRTPLTAIIGFSDALSGGYFGPLPPKQKEYIDTIGISAQHLLALINNLLDVAKIESGHYELDEEEIDLGDMVERLIRLVQQRADQQGITIENRIADVWIRADSNAMQQMLTNLLANAVKFTSGGGAIEIAAGPGEEGYDVSVRDTGVGIPSEYREQVMLPYVRVSGARRAEGTGLGLPLVKALIELHGGALLLDSELGKGTTVTLRFPLNRVVSTASPPVAS